MNAAKAPRSQGMVYPYYLAVGTDVQHVDRETHEMGVDGIAGQDEQPLSGLEAIAPHQTAEPGPEAVRQSALGDQGLLTVEIDNP